MTSREEGAVRLDAHPQITIRLLQRDDAPIICEFYASLTERETYYFYPHPLDDEHAGWLASDADNPELIAVLATEHTPEGERMDGYAYIRRNAGGEWWFGVCIRPGRQDHGLGTRLLSDLTDRARAAGVQRIGLHVHLTNPRAQALYRKFGFEVVDEVISREQGVPMYIMIAQVS
jgi:ribosomal protein S18 acetylase RimI-like enzyme